MGAFGRNAASVRGVVFRPVAAVKRLFEIILKGYGKTGFRSRLESEYKAFKMNGRHEETRTPDLYRVNRLTLGFSTTYSTVGTA